MINHKIIVAITGSSGAIYGIRLLETLKKLNVETHLIISKAAHITLKCETLCSLSELKKLSYIYYNYNDISAKISSGSFKTNGMIIAPCSMKTVAAISNGYEDNLISRAASVTIKERRHLALMIRESPLHTIHLKNLLKLSKIGVSIVPPVAAFYNNPKTIDDIVNHSIMRMLDLFSLDADLTKRWNGIINV